MSVGVDRPRQHFGRVPDIGIFLTHTDHDTLVAGATDDGTESQFRWMRKKMNHANVREDGTRSVIA